MTLIYFLIVIGILVFVHEFGHFIVAKRPGAVEKFSLGMGPKWWATRKATRSTFSRAPARRVREDGRRESRRGIDRRSGRVPVQDALQRAKIAAAGSLTNIVLAFVLMPLVYMIGTYAEGRRRSVSSRRIPCREGGVPGRRRHHRDQRQEDRRLDQGPVAHRRESDTEVSVTLDRKGEKKVLALAPRRPRSSGSAARA